MAPRSPGGRVPGALLMRLAVVLLLMPALAACHDLHAVPSTHLDELVHVDEPGIYVHPGSGIEFPEKAGGFVRVDVSRYDSEGNDVGVHYRRFVSERGAAFRVGVTIFVFPSL